MQIKQGVIYASGGIKVSPELGYALGIAELIYRRNSSTLTITSLMDGEHNSGSLHTKGMAADLRTRDITDAIRLSIYEDIKTELTPLGFDVIWEGGIGATPMTTGAHIHIEFDPKPPNRVFWKLETA